MRGYVAVCGIAFLEQNVQHWKRQVPRQNARTHSFTRLKFYICWTCKGVNAKCILKKRERAQIKSWQFVETRCLFAQLSWNAVIFVRSSLLENGHDMWKKKTKLSCTLQIFMFTSLFCLFLYIVPMLNWKEADVIYCNANEKRTFWTRKKEDEKKHT